MNAVAQGGDRCVNDFDVKGQHARGHGSGRDAAYGLEKIKPKRSEFSQE